jgi:hypothetical protein
MFTKVGGTRSIGKNQGRTLRKLSKKEIVPAADEKIAISILPTDKTEIAVTHVTIGIVATITIALEIVKTTVVRTALGVDQRTQRANKTKQKLVKLKDTHSQSIRSQAITVVLILKGCRTLKQIKDWESRCQ